MSTSHQQTIIRLPPRWINGLALEGTLRIGPSPFSSSGLEVHFHVPRRCNLMTEAAVRLLSLLNQLNYATRRVFINFEENAITCLLTVKLNWTVSLHCRFIPRGTVSKLRFLIAAWVCCKRCDQRCKIKLQLRDVELLVEVFRQGLISGSAPNLIIISS